MNPNTSNGFQNWGKTNAFKKAIAPDQLVLLSHKTPCSNPPNVRTEANIPFDAGV